MKPERPNKFPAVDEESDRKNDANGQESNRYLSVGNLIGKVPESVWRANAVVPRHRTKAHVYWGLLLVGYVIYIALVSDLPHLPGEI